MTMQERRYINVDKLEFAEVIYNSKIKTLQCK